MALLTRDRARAMIDAALTAGTTEGSVSQQTRPAMCPGTAPYLRHGDGFWRPRP